MHKQECAEVVCITVFYMQHADCAVDIILSFGRIHTTPVRGYWTVGSGMDMYSGFFIPDSKTTGIFL